MEEENQGEEGEQEQVTLSPDDLKALREKAKEVDRLTKEHGALQRRMAFVDAKIDVTDPKMGYFVKGYEGDLTSDAIRAEAEKAGLLGGQQQQVPQGELDAHQRMSNAVAGGETPPPGNYDAEIAKCNSVDEVMAVATKYGVPNTWNRPS